MNEMLQGWNWMGLTPTSSEYSQFCMCEYKGTHKNARPMVHKVCLKLPLPTKASGYITEMLQSV